MREKLQTLPLAQLRELAKSQNIRNVSGLRKSELVDRLCEMAESSTDVKEPQPSTRPDERPEPRTEARTEPRTEARTEARPETRTEARPEARTEARPGTRMGSRPEQRTEER